MGGSDQRERCEGRDSVHVPVSGDRQVIKPELVWDDEGVTEYNGERYKRIAHEDARAVQYDVQLYFSSTNAVWTSVLTPEERRTNANDSAEWENTYWAGIGRQPCVRVEPPKPEYECEQPT